MTDKKYGVLLVNLGTPTEPTVPAVRQFLKEFLSDKRVVDLPRVIWLPILYGVILTFRPRKVALNYQKIWTEQGSPLMVYSLQQQNQLQNSLNKLSSPTAQIKVELAMTYGQPSIQNSLASLDSWGADEIIVLPLYPQYSNTTTASVKDQLAKLSPLLKQELTFINDYHDEDSYISALVDSIKEKFNSHDKLIFSFHGIPKRYVEQGDPYQSQCIKTAELVAQKLNLTAAQWEIAYQSRVGKEEWLKPYFDLRMSELATEGSKNILVISPGFSVDCLETLEEIVIQNKETFLSNGGEIFEYVNALNAQPSHIKMMVDLVQKQIKR
jgi:protoporphyrin/coproporphyrin ferrochelatase